ncbi:MAG: short-chain dehydrogenase [Deltaproteobacteria bacterium]|nr:short-chain dehydrogenase [Deltaproteobacteria bacterium]
MTDEPCCLDRVVVVTGAGRGIGRAYALALAREGARLVVNDLGVERDGRNASSAPANEVVAEIEEAGGEAIPDVSDIATREGADSLIAAAVARFGRVDAVVNNAGIDRPGLLIDLADEDWDAVVDVHLKAQFLVLRAVARHWRTRSEQGEDVAAAIVNTSSPAALTGFRGEGAYSAAKAAVLALTSTAADELSDFGVTVNAVVPGAATRLTDWSPGTPGPEAIAPLIVWLASLDARDITGRVFSAAGGIFMVLHGWEAGSPFVIGDGGVPDLAAGLRERVLSERQPMEVLAPGRNLPARPDAPGNLG